LMAKDEDLKILGTIAVTIAGEETGEQPNDQAEEEQHRRILESEQSRIRVIDPHAPGTPRTEPPPATKTSAARNSSSAAVARQRHLETKEKPATQPCRRA
jgi:hypothetical protein